MKYCHKNIVKLLDFKITFFSCVFEKVIYSCDGKDEFSAAIIPVKWSHKK